jgi:hypothetical protein
VVSERGAHPHHQHRTTGFWVFAMKNKLEQPKEDEKE